MYAAGWPAAVFATLLSRVLRHGNKWFKIILLYLVCNGAPALVFGTLAVLVATVPLVPWSLNGK